MYSIEVRNISKTFRLYEKPIDRLKEAFLRKPFHKPFECLKDIRFSVPLAGSLGVIGDNGAGKSTLLKVLAGTLTPSSGELVSRGRSAALLELGAGFHQEFTGRQNIYLNGSLMGLSRAEIKEREEAIIEFAELGSFIDRPIKIYSSGMVVRLAFSIATSVDPDILIVDEALSVGDQYFQKKCVDRMMGFKAQGKTIIFCSHSMYMVNQLCERSLWLDRGQIRKQGVATQVTAAYESYLRDKTGQREEQEKHPLPSTEKGLPVVIKSVTLNDEPGPVMLGYRQNLNVVVEIESPDNRPFSAAIGIRRNDHLICNAVTMSRDGLAPLCGKGVARVLLRYPSVPLLHGEYFVVASLLDESGLHVYHKKESASFTIIPPEKWSEEVGLLNLDHEWKILQDLTQCR